jgi:hypothetical protein
MHPPAMLSEQVFAVEVIEPFVLGAGNLRRARAHVAPVESELEML